MRRSSYRRLRRTVYHHLNQQEKNKTASSQQSANSKIESTENAGCLPAIIFFIVLSSLSIIFNYIYEKNRALRSFESREPYFILTIIFMISSVVIPFLLINVFQKHQKKMVIILSIFYTIIIVIGLIIASIPPKHECIFEHYGSSTSTCCTLGTTTYECYFKEYYGCKEKQVVQDTEYADCSYDLTIVSDKIDITVCKSICRNCGKILMEEVKNSYGTWGNNKIRDTGRNGDTFHAILFHEENPPDLYAVLYFFDKDGNKIGYWYSHELLLSSHRDTYLVTAYLENELPSNCYAYRWDLQSYEKIGEPHTFIPVK